MSIKKGRVVGKRWQVTVASTPQHLSDKHAQVLKEIGEGAFCKVFMANDLEKGEQVAIKIDKKNVSKQLLSWEDEVGTIDCGWAVLTPVQVLRALQFSRHVVRHYAFDSLGPGEGNYLVMEVVPRHPNVLCLMLFCSADGGKCIHNSQAAAERCPQVTLR